MSGVDLFLQHQVKQTVTKNLWSDHSSTAVAAAAPPADAETADATTSEKVAATTSTDSSPPVIAAVAVASSVRATLSSAIRVLPESVVDRIAAGEVVQRAASAIKELCENSLDAGATQIRITIVGSSTTAQSTSAKSKATNATSSSSSLTAFTISDNGCGIQKEDLQLVCTRHATSKLSAVDDLQSMSTYGFRGEALASISRVARRVTITSKPSGTTTNTTTSATATNTSVVGYQLHYANGGPYPHATTQPTPIARTVGTTIAVQDLFYNVPSRQRLRFAAEYQAVLAVLQKYALHCAATNGASIACIKENSAGGGGGNSTSRTGRGSVGSTTTDLHTAPFVAALQQFKSQSLVEKVGGLNAAMSINKEVQQKHCALQEKATKQVIGHVYGADLIPNLLPLECSLVGDVNEGEWSMVDAPSDEKKVEDDVVNDSAHCQALHERQQHSIYSCSGYIAAPTTESSTSRPRPSSRRRAAVFVLFINHRLVDSCPTLLRAVQDVYAEWITHNCSNGSSSSSNQPLWIYLSLVVPPHTVDVNVHPTKREVALLHLDRIVEHLTGYLRDKLLAVEQSFGSSLAQLVDSKNSDKPSTIESGETNRPSVAPVSNPYARSSSNKRKLLDSTETSSESTAQPPKRQEMAKPPVKSMVRTSRSSMQAGSLEPFLVRTMSQSQKTQSTREADRSPSMKLASSRTSVDSADFLATSSQEPQAQHRPDCPLQTTLQGQNIDLSLPGAFATAALRCDCPVVHIKSRTSTLSSFPVTPTPSQSLVGSMGSSRLRLQRVPPTTCPYTSIQQLRSRIQDQRSADLEEQLRSSCFVGVVSHDRSLLQCGEQLVLLNHSICAQQLFYQLALYRFGGGCGLATLGQDETTMGAKSKGGIDIVTVVSQFVQMEELLQATNDTDRHDLVAQPDLVAINETNQALAEQAGDCLLQHADMLLEYYSIRIEKNNHTNGRILLTGLPVLLEGYEPSPHGLPLFLLRLATEVEWTQEKPCFEGICRELGYYYARLPSLSDDELDAFSAKIRHILFPSISALLIPPKALKKGNFVSLTSLPKLYRVFERC